MWYPTLVGKENETPFIWVWKPFPNKHILKPWEEARKGKPKRTISASGGFGPLQKMYIQVLLNTSQSVYEHRKIF